MQYPINKVLFIYAITVLCYWAIATIFTPWVALAIIAIEMLCRTLLTAYSTQQVLDAMTEHVNDNVPIDEDKSA